MSENGTCQGCAESKEALASRALRESVSIVPYGRESEASVPVSMTSREVLANMLEQSSGGENVIVSQPEVVEPEAPPKLPGNIEPLPMGPARTTMPAPLARMLMPRAATHVMLVPGGSIVGGYGAPRRIPALVANEMFDPDPRLNSWPPFDVPQGVKIPTKPGWLPIRKWHDIANVLMALLARYYWKRLAGPVSEKARIIDENELFDPKEQLKQKAFGDCPVVRRYYLDYVIYAVRLRNQFVGEVCHLKPPEGMSDDGKEAFEDKQEEERRSRREDIVRERNKLCDETQASYDNNPDLEAKVVEMIDSNPVPVAWIEELLRRETRLVECPSGCGRMPNRIISAWGEVDGVGKVVVRPNVEQYVNYRGETCEAHYCETVISVEVDYVVEFEIVCAPIV